MKRWRDGFTTVMFIWAGSQDIGWGYNDIVFYESMLQIWDNVFPELVNINTDSPGSYDIIESCVRLSSAHASRLTALLLDEHRGHELAQRAG